jgi:hypothetical protein
MKYVAGLLTLALCASAVCIASHSSSTGAVCSSRLGCSQVGAELSCDAHVSNY